MLDCMPEQYVVRYVFDYEIQHAKLYGRGTDMFFIRNLQSGCAEPN